MMKETINLQRRIDMVELFEKGAYLLDGKHLVNDETQELHEELAKRNNMDCSKAKAKKGTISYGILQEHNTGCDDKNLRIKFDSITSHDITYVGIIQTAKASGMDNFPLPYVLTNCHNSLCAVGGTINEDDHLFGLSACKKYGGIYVPPNIAVIHQYMRETMAGCGKMILGSDSHTRYGALGTIAIGEGGGELVKQLLNDTYDLSCPDVIAVYLDGQVNPGVGPQDIALAIIKAVFKCGYVKNKIMEFVGPGIASMTTDFRNGIDVMTTETTCLSSIWQTDNDTKEFLAVHGRVDEYKELKPASIAYYEGAVYVNLTSIKPMIALPFHPSNAYEIDELNANLEDILHQVEEDAVRVTGNKNLSYKLTDKIVNGKLMVSQGIIAGCAGGNYTNVMEAAHLLKGHSCGMDEFALSVYPSSQPVYYDLIKKGAISTLMEAGAVLKPAFCGPCFGAGDTPANNGLSIRHTTRNFPNREGSKPGQGQMATVALMDARSIAATAANGGILTSAEHFADSYDVPKYAYDATVYKNRVLSCFQKGDKDKELIYGPNIKDWPINSSLGNNILLKVCSKILDSVTTTDELIPSGETSSYRSNPLGLAQYALSRRDPQYVVKATAVEQLEQARTQGSGTFKQNLEIQKLFERIKELPECKNVKPEETEIGSVIYCVKPGDGSAREQAASCQRVLGGLANICKEYATKRYRSNVINWGMLPFQMMEEPEFNVDDYIFIPNVVQALDGDGKKIKAYVIGDKVKEITLFMNEMTKTEKDIIKAGSLINFNRTR
jgi:aconitate hydratase